jgi:hypothetical protein
MCPRVRDSLIPAILAASLAGGSGCPSGERSERARVDPAAAAEARPGALSGRPVVPIESSIERASTARPDAGFTLALTSVRLEAYMAYQARMVEVWQRMLAAPGGKQQLEALMVHARAEAQAREDSGLTEAELGRLDVLVSEVLARRSAARATEAEKGLEQLTQLQKLQYQLPADQQAALARSVEELKLAHEAQVALTDERRRFGSANVDLVLAKEAQLAASWERFVAVVGGAPEPGRRSKRREKRPGEAGGSPPP